MQYGFSPSAVISIESNYGTNSIHGGIFEFIRNGALNASNWFSGSVDGLKQSQFGGYIGAPIIKDKLFIFANYQGTRKSLASATQTSYTSTAAMLRGDFSALPLTLKAPFAIVRGLPTYDIASPVFEKTTIHLENGKDFVIIAHHASRTNKYVQSIRLNR